MKGPNKKHLNLKKLVILVQFSTFQNQTFSASFWLPFENQTIQHPGSFGPFEIWKCPDWISDTHCEPIVMYFLAQ